MAGKQKSNYFPIDWQTYKDIEHKIISMKDISCRSCAYFHDVVMFGQTDRQKDNPIYRVYAHKISTSHFRYHPSKKHFPQCP